MLRGGQRRQLLASMGAAIAVVAVASASVMAWRGYRGLATIDRWSRIVAPLALLCVVPALVSHGVWDALTTVLAIGVFVLLLERLLRVSLAELGTPMIPWRAPRFGGK